MSTYSWIQLLCFLPPIVCAAPLFKRAGKPVATAFVPIANFAGLLQLAGQSPWRMVLFLVPYLNLVMFAFWCRALAQAFGKSNGFGIGLIALSPVYFPLLAFGDASYVSREAASGTTPGDQPAAQAAAAPQAEKVGGVGGFVMKLVIALPFAALIIWLRGSQEDEFKDKSRADALHWCLGKSGCEQALASHFESCFDDYHSSQRRGRHSRTHQLDENGFHNCLQQHFPSPIGTHKAAMDRAVADETSETQPAR